MGGMMRTIWKYEIPLDKKSPKDAFTLDLPFGYKIVHVGVIGEKAYMWAVVETEDVTYPVKFVLLPTGHIIPSVYDYVGSFKYAFLMCHLFVDYREGANEESNTDN
jgi:hypothetical protein